MNRYLKFLLTIFFLVFFPGCPRKEEVKRTEVPLRVVYPPELTNYMHNLKKYLESPGSEMSVTIKLELLPEYPINAANKISSGDIKAEAWISPMHSLIDYANSKIINLGARHSVCHKIFSTPTVIVSQDTFIENFKDKGRFFSWNDFFALTAAASAQSGQEYIVSYAVGMSETTASGLSSLLQLMYFAKPDQSKSLNASYFSDSKFQPKFEEFINKISYYSPKEDNLFYKASVMQDHLFFSISTEQQLVSYNKSRPAELKRLYALYPTEGSVWLDYNFCESDADWVSPIQKAALKELSQFIQSGPQQAEAIKNGFRAAKAGQSASEYESFVNNGAVDIVSDSNAALIEDNVLGQIFKNSDKLKRPFAAIYLLDISGSTQKGNVLSAGKRLMRALLASSSSKDLSSLISFSDHVEILAGFSNQHGEKIKTLDALEGTGGSALYDAVTLSISQLTAEPLKSYRKVLYIFTDGNDNNSKTSLGTLVDLIRETRRHHDINVEIVAIPSGTDDLSDVSRISKAFNGNMYKTNITDIDRIVADLSAAY